MPVLIPALGRAAALELPAGDLDALRERVSRLAENRPADHVGLLLTFAGHLLDADPNPAMLVSFSNDHLLWIYDFCDRLSSEARHPFYRELAESTRTALGSYTGNV